MDAAITTTLIASGSAIGGIIIKMAYDTVSAHVESKREPPTDSWSSAKPRMTDFGQRISL
jgi:hypothetical protein